MQLIGIKAITKTSVAVLLRNANNGLHVNLIAKHLVNEHSDLFSDPLPFDKVKKKVNAMLLADIKKGEQSRFVKVKWGTYKLKPEKRRDLLY